MNHILLSAILGLVAGLGHGVVSHYADLPVSLVEQVVPGLQQDTL
ncbi:MAG: hypothetical protein AAF289_12170 [Cyanobacteria bacterium P01_A01_bin.135]